MRYIKLILSLIGFCAFTNVWAQLSTNEKPVSFGRESELRVSRRSAQPSVTMPRLNLAKIKKDIADNNGSKEHARFGFKHKVNYNLGNSGTSYELPNGDKLWQLYITCPDAKSVHFYFDKFWLPDGGKLFVYSKDKKQTLGAFTSRNNKGNREHLRGFATGLIYGSEVVLEYYQPKEVTTDAIISVNYVVHGFRFPENDYVGFNKSGLCMVNINCEEGYSWRGEQKAVAHIIMDETDEYASWCSGALITTTNPHGEPFLLTADHCLPGTKDASCEYFYDNILDNALFYWNYETPGCERDTIEPPIYSTSGAILVSNDNSFLDFALLWLTEDPKELANFIPYYLGWDNSGLSGGAGVCIHHPKGDVKKISTVDTSEGVVSAYYLISNFNERGDHWKVKWTQTEHGYGTVEDGSSGSPLLNANHKVIGQLHGGRSNCSNNLYESDWFAKFSESWIGYVDERNHDYRRLNCWLDSLGTNNVTMEGLLYVSKTCVITDDECIYGNIRITGTGQLTVQGNIEMGGNGTLTVEPGGKLFIDGGKLTNAKLDLKPGSTLHIINNGIIETRNGFNAPVGAIVEISHGKIL